MAIKVGLENNILKIDDGVDIEYFNAGWTYMRFSATKVFLRDAVNANLDPYDILFTVFQ